MKRKSLRRSLVVVLVSANCATSGPQVAHLGPTASNPRGDSMPLPNRCVGRYTREARQAAIEGTVVLDLVVGVDGRARDVQIVSGLGYGLDEAAIEAIVGCHFDPGEKGGVPVAVRIRGFKIKFFLRYYGRGAANPFSARSGKNVGRWTG